MRDPETVDPSQPEASPEATLRLPVGVPADPFSTQRLNVSDHLNAASTQKLQLGGSMHASDQTQKLTLSRMDEPPIRIQKVDQPAEAAGQTQQLPMVPDAPRPLGWKVPLAVGALLVVGAAAYLVFSRGPALPPPPAYLQTAPSSPSVVVTPEPVPPAAQAYVEQAKAGDTHAMRMLGVMYLNGLNVPKDREKGLYWYRQAAEKGSDAARAELSKIEGGR